MTPRVGMLLMANVAVFFLQAVAGLSWTLFAYVPRLAMVRPWTIITYMFFHGGVMHILFNMVALYFFGPQVEARLGSRRFTMLYFISGIAGALAQSYAPNVPIIGASAGVFGVMLAFAWFWPTAQILIWGIVPVQARVLVIISTVFALWMVLGGTGGNVAHFAHLGGYAGAFLYLRWLQRGRQEFRRRAEGPAREALNKVRQLHKRPHVDLTSVHELNREEVNRILDKISAEGMGSLTPQERLFLSNFVPPDDRVPPAS